MLYAPWEIKRDFFIFHYYLEKRNITFYFCLDKQHIAKLALSYHYYKMPLWEIKRDFLSDFSK
jgi:hypothetical protein